MRWRKHISDALSVRIKATLRPFLRYRDSYLCNLDIANSQPMIFCLLLVNLLLIENQLDNLIDYSFPETSYSYLMDIDQDYLDSLSSLHHHNDNNQEEGEGGSSNFPILHANRFEISYKVSHHNMLGRVNNRQTYPINQDNKEEGEGGSRNSPTLHAKDATCEYNIKQHNNLQRLNNRQTYPNNQEEGEGGGSNSPILHANRSESSYKVSHDNRLGRLNNRQTLPGDVMEFIDLCERGVLYDDLMRRLGIPAQRRKEDNGIKSTSLRYPILRTSATVLLED